MACTHDITDRDVAVSADGMCPICQMEEIERLRNALIQIADPLTVKLDTYGTGTKRALEIIIALRGIARKALE